MHQHNSFERPGWESTLVRQRITKFHSPQPLSACAPDNEKNQLGSALHSSLNTNCRQSDYSLSNCGQQSDNSATTKPLGLNTESPAKFNYANMQFINSIALYENLCFLPNNCNSNGSIEKLKLNKGDVEYIKENSSSVQSPSLLQRESQSPNVDGCGSCTSDQHRYGDGERDTDSISHKQSLELPTDETDQIVMNGTDGSMNGHSGADDCECNHNTISTEVQQEPHLQSDSVKDKRAEKEAYQNGNISFSGPRGRSRRANNGEHYRSHDRKEVNISLSSSSSLHNRVGCYMHQVNVDNANTRQCSPPSTTKWSISNAIIAQHRHHHHHHHHCGKSLLRSKSYSIDDITSAESFFNYNKTLNRFGSSGKCLCCNNGPGDHHQPLFRKHHSDQVINVGKLNHRFLCEEHKHRTLSCFGTESDSETEDFCTSSQITVLCHSQTESV